MAKEENQTPKNTKYPQKPSISDENGENKDTLFTPRFRSVAAMAGWDEEALLLAALVVEDTPERDLKQKKRIGSQFRTPPLSSRRNKRVRRRNSQTSIPMVVLDLDNDGEESGDKKKEINTSGTKENVVEESRKETDEKKKEINTNGSKENVVVEGSKKDAENDAKIIECNKDGTEKDVVKQASSGDSSGSALPCMNRLKEELSCAICLDICFEPSTTSCGHSFCKKCLRSAADKCGKKCPKCRQLISNGRSCTVNTVLWNTIQLLFPQEVEARKAAEATKICEPTRRPSVSKEKSEITYRSTRPSVATSREGSTRPSFATSRDGISERRRRSSGPSQADDAALALRLQREEFMAVSRESQEQGRSSFTTAAGNSVRVTYSSARENLRAMASRANNLRVRRA